MRIAITTWHTGFNSGTFFQCYGLYCYLKNRGHEVKVIDYIHQPSDQINRGLMYYLSQPYGLFKRKIKRYKVAKQERVNILPFKQQIEIRNQSFGNLWQLMEYTKPIQTQKDFEELNRYFDAFVVGSDQVWNATMLNRRYLLDYVADGKLKVAYGPSIGVGTIFRYSRKVYRDYIKSFNYVAVRERLLCNLLNEEIPSLNARHLIDPSMLYPREEYIKMAKLPKGIIPERYVICYFAPNTKQQEQVIRQYAEKHGFKIVVMAMFGYSWTMTKDTIICPDPTEFVGLIANAAAVFTSSFHCTIFSIMLHRNLFVFQRQSDSKSGDINQRYVEQLETYGISHRLIHIGSELNDEILKPIDYDKVETIFQQRLSDSKKFLDKIF